MILTTLFCSIDDFMKEFSYSQIEHTRHRAPCNFLINLLSGLIAYQFKEKKPSIHVRQEEEGLLMAV